MRTVVRAVMKGKGKPGNLDDLVALIDEHGPDAVVAALTDQVNPATGKPFGEEACKAVVQKALELRAREKQRVTRLAELRTPWSWTDILKAKGGEGSRGGKIIGHTRSGKAIYERAGVKEGRPYRTAGEKGRFSSFDHQDAAEAHAREAERHTAAGNATEARSHEAHSQYHATLARHARHAEEKASGGMRVLGQTRSGKPIYASGVDHPGHADFTDADHNDASLAHAAAADEQPERQTRVDHRRMAIEHAQRAEKAPSARAKSWTWRSLFGGEAAR